MKKKTTLITLVSLAAFVIGFASVTNAVESESMSQKMVNTKSAVTVEPGDWEFELGLDYTRHIGTPYYNNSWGTGRRPKVRLWDWTMTAKYGLREGTDIFLSAGWFDIKDRAMPMFGIDEYGRGLKDVTVGMTQQLNSQNENIALAYIPALVIPVGREFETSGRLGIGRDFWELKQTLAATMYSDDARINANLSHSIPFGRTREYYATPFMMPQENVRGITELGVEAAVPNETRVEPMANLNYAHQWISHGKDSDLITAGLGVKVQLTESSELLVGYDYPVTGRNSLRAQSWKVGLTGSF